MAIKVIPATAIALTVSFVEPGFVVWADYKVDVDYREASYVAEWREIAVEAAVSRPDVLAVDIIDPTEQISKEFIKARTDAFSVVQGTTTIDFGKNPSDIFSVVDADPTKAFAKFLTTSSAGFFDEVQLNQLKTLADSVVAGSAEAKAFTKALQDFQAFTDTAVIATDKSLESEVITLSDATNLTYIIGKQLEDLQAVVESLAIAIQKAPFLEGLNLIDNMDGDIEFGLIKVVGELQLLVEQIQSIDTTKALVDAPIIDENLAKSITKAPFEDTTAPVDASAKEAIKPFTDGIVAAHAQTVRDVAKALADIYGEFIDVLSYAFSKSLADTQPIEELLAKTITKAPFTDNVAAQDLYVSTIDKLFANAVSPESDTALTINKVFADSFALADEFTQVKAILRDFTDTFDALDAYSADVQPSESDSTGVTDDETLNIGLAKAEILNMLDNMDGDLTYAIVKSLTTELIVVSEEIAVDSALQKADTAVLGSAGSLLSQDYVEPGYFAEDYVGTSRTFS